MKILITTHYFYPENFLINDIAKKLNDLGHQITIATSNPNYPQGKIFENYKKFSVSKELYNKIEINRIPVYPRGTNKFQLFLNYFSFILSGIFFFPILLRKKQFDIIFHYGAGPITSSIPSIFLKIYKKSKLIIWVQDLYPDTLKSYKFTSNSIIISLISFIVKFIYFFSDLILVQSKGFIQSINRYSKNKKIIFYPNSIVDIKEIIQSKNQLSTDLLNKFKRYKCFVFAGNLGEVQSLETLVNTCKNLEKYNEFKMVLVGTGSRINWLKEEIKKKKISNLIIAGPFDLNNMAYIYDLADSLIITLNADSHFSKTIPSKLQTYLASGKPIVGAISGEAGKIIKQSGSGLVCSSEDEIKLTEIIITMMNKSENERKIMGQNGRRYFKDNYDINFTIIELEKIFMKAISSN